MFSFTSHKEKEIYNTVNYSDLQHDFETKKELRKYSLNEEKTKFPYQKDKLCYKMGEPNVCSTPSFELDICKDGTFHLRVQLYHLTKSNNQEIKAIDLRGTYEFNLKEKIIEFHSLESNTTGYCNYLKPEQTNDIKNIQWKSPFFYWSSKYVICPYFEMKGETTICPIDLNEKNPSKMVMLKLIE